MIFQHTSCSVGSGCGDKRQRLLHYGGALMRSNGSQRSWREIGGLGAVAEVSLEGLRY